MCRSVSWLEQWCSHGEGGHKLPKIGKKREKIRKKWEKEGGQGGQSASLDSKQIAKNRGKEGENQEKEGKRGKIRKVLSLCPSWQIGLATPLDQRPIYRYSWCNAVSDQCLHKYLYFIKLIMWMVSYIPYRKLFWPMTTCQECQGKVEFLIVEEVVYIFGEVT